MLGGHRQGDTMIEVLFAVTIFSLVAVLGLTIMNQGAAASQRSLEVTLVRQEIDAQAEALRLLYDEAMAQRAADTGGNDEDLVGSASEVWNDIITNHRVESATSWSSMVNGDACAYPADSSRVFTVNTVTGTLLKSFSEPTLYARVIYDGVAHSEGVWIEAVRVGKDSATGVMGYTDFHIRACWSAIGQSVPTTLGTIVRLYEHTP